MPRLITFIGLHNAGKTRLIRRVAAELRNRGFRLGIIKSTKHNISDWERAGSDTCLYRQDGIEDLALAGRDTILRFMPNRPLSLGHLVLELFPDMDIVIGEGFKNAGNVPKIEVARLELSGTRGLLKDRVSGVVAGVSDFGVPGIVNFDFDQVPEVADFIVTSGIRISQRG